MLHLNASARIWLWGILFVGWTPLAVWALPAGLAVAMLAYRSCLSVAQTYGNLIEAAFDLYRNDLYRALRWPLPENPEAEQKSGMLLSEFLWRGPVRPIPPYRPE